MKTDVLTLDGNATLETYLLDRPYGPALLPMAVICPGGGYLDCSPTEGECVALRFNNRNCHAAVLHYATAKSAPGHSHFPRPLEDLAEAICLIRRNARDWGVAPDRIVIVGFRQELTCAPFTAATGTGSCCRPRVRPGSCGPMP